jgi:hypothetical protein
MLRAFVFRRRRRGLKPLKRDTKAYTTETRAQATTTDATNRRELRRARGLEMNRLTQILLMALAVFATCSLSRAQDEPLWQIIGTTTDKKTGEITIFQARDCHRFTDAESAKYPKLAIRQQTGDTPPTKEAVDEYDCKRRASRIRIWLYKDGTEKIEKNLDWVEVVPGSVGEALLKYACRDRSKEMN